MAHSILVVDDSDTIRETVRLALAGEDWQATEAGSIDEALAALETPDLPDLVLSDVGLTDGDGYELCRKLRESARWRALPVVLMGAKISDKAAMAAGASAVLGKPFQAEELVRTLQETLEQESFGMDFDALGEPAQQAEEEPVGFEDSENRTQLAPDGAEAAEEVEIIDLSEDEGDFEDLELLEDLEPIAASSEPAAAATDNPAGGALGGLEELDLESMAEFGAEPDEPGDSFGLRDLEVEGLGEAAAAGEDGLDLGGVDFDTPAQPGNALEEDLDSPVPAGSDAAAEVGDGPDDQGLGDLGALDLGDLPGFGPEQEPSATASSDLAEASATDQAELLQGTQGEETATAPKPESAEAEDGAPPDGVMESFEFDLDDLTRAFESPEPKPSPAADEGVAEVLPPGEEAAPEGPAEEPEPFALTSEEAEAESATAPTPPPAGMAEPLPETELELDLADSPAGEEPEGADAAAVPGDVPAEPGTAPAQAPAAATEETAEAPAGEEVAPEQPPLEEPLTLPDFSPSWEEAPASEAGAAGSQPPWDVEAAPAGTATEELARVAEDAVRRSLEHSLNSENLAPLVAQTVERVVWEVVPQLAERLIREALEKLQEEPPAE